MNLEIQKFLRAFGDPDAALAAAQAEPLNLKVSRVGNLVCINYDQIASPKSDPISAECRGLILRYGTWDVVNQSFRRFYNYGEGLAAPLDWSSARVQEKLDGSLICVWHHPEENRWEISTRGTIGATGGVGYGAAMTFRERVLPLLDMDYFSRHSSSWCFSFEYVGPYNRIVTPYVVEEMYLLAVFDRGTGLEVTHLVEDGSLPRTWRIPRVFAIGSLENALASFEKIPPLEEGYVVRDNAGNRVKVKNPAYLAIHAAINAGDQPTAKNFARIALAGRDSSEIKSYFPEFADEIERFEKAADDMADDAEDLFARSLDLVTQKEFALAVKEHPLSAWMFQNRAGKTILDARTWMAENCRLEHFLAHVERPEALAR